MEKTSGVSIIAGSPESEGILQRNRIGPAPGERDLATLRRCMSPVLDEVTYVFCNFPDFRLPPEVEPICTFREHEGMTAIVDKRQARAPSAGVPL